MKRAHHSWTGRLATESCKCNNFNRDRIFGNDTPRETIVAPILTPAQAGVNSSNMNHLHVLPCLDSHEMAAFRRRELDIPRHLAASLGRSAVEATVQGRYLTEDGREVVWNDAVQAAVLAKRSIPPELSLPSGSDSRFRRDACPGNQRDHTRCRATSG